mmetsp:Transcript_40134/g.51711  ORF Transcript_40134/g.51711 Transcript_40134/m.51711 type:complete len:177 (-) Transcript_40134:606-1136(-)
MRSLHRLGLFSSIFASTVFGVDIRRLDGSTESKSSLKKMLRIRPRVLESGETEVDDGKQESDCNKLLYTSISFMIEEAENLPVPDSPTIMYASLTWDLDDTIETTMGNETKTQVKRRSTTDTVTESRRQANWEDDGYFEFDNVCGEDKMIIEIYEENSGYVVTSKPFSVSLLSCSI